MGGAPTATSGYLIAERLQSIEHFGCGGTLGTEGQLGGHLIVVVTDADRVFETPGPEQESADGNANLPNLGHSENVSHPHRTGHDHLPIGHREFACPVFGPDDSREDLSLPGVRGCAGFTFGTAHVRCLN